MISQDTAGFALSLTALALMLAFIVRDLNRKGRP